MEIIFIITYHPAMVTDDIPKLNGSLKKSIKQAIEQKLTTEPLLYGAPLRKNLHGLFKLRVRDYRVIYYVEKQVVKVVAIQHRREVYKNSIEQRFD